MKATIDGVEVEGTPDEVWALLQHTKGMKLQPYQPMPDWNGPWWGIFPPSTTVPRVWGSTGTTNPLKINEIISFDGQTELHII